jgi:pantoate kinase
MVIEEGVVAKAVPSRRPMVKILPPRRMPDENRLPIIETAMARLGVSAAVAVESPLPAGAGFGLSAAGLLSSISALSVLFDLGLGKREIAALAHEIEVTHRTGLGDVAACQGGGIECRKGPGIDAEIVRIADPGRVICAVSIGPIPTPAVLGDAGRMESIGQAFPGRCPRDLGDLLGLSRAFTEASGLVTPRVREVLRACDRAGIGSSMTMLGEGVFADGEEAGEVLLPFGPVYRLHIARQGFTRGRLIA